MLTLFFEFVKEIEKLLQRINKRQMKKKIVSTNIERVNCLNVYMFVFGVLNCANKRYFFLFELSATMYRRTEIRQNITLNATPSIDLYEKPLLRSSKMKFILFSINNFYITNSSTTSPLSKYFFEKNRKTLS